MVNCTGYHIGPLFYARNGEQMRPEEVRRIRKRIDTTLSNFRSIYGCYVNAAGEIVTTMEIPVLDMETEEREMYAAILKKVLSGKAERKALS